MALKIRLTRGGSKKRPYYRIIVADVRAPRDGRYIEKIGSYDPMLPKDHADRIKFDVARVEYWLSVGAKPTDRIARFLQSAKIGSVTRTIPNQTKKNQLKAKAKLRLEEAAAKAEEAKAEAKAKAEEAKAEAKAKAEAPAEAEASAE